MRRCYICRKTDDEVAFTEASKNQCADCARIKSRKYYLSNKKKCDEYNLKWAADNPVRIKQIRNKSNAKSRLAIKELIILHYSSGTNQCGCCGESMIEFLTIDHMNNNGRAERERTGRYGTQFYWTLKKNGFPPGYQVLCFNCNCARAHQPDKICPHKKVIV